MVQRSRRRDGATTTNGGRVRVAIVVLAALGTFVLAIVSARLVDPASGNPAVWLPAGAALGVLAGVPPRRWPPLLAGGVVGSLAADLLATAGDVAQSVGWTAAFAASWTIAALVARALADGVPDLRRSRHVGALVVAAAVGTATVSVLGGLVSIVLDQTTFAAATGTWWLSDMAAALALAPLVLTVRRPQGVSFREAARLLLAAGLGALVAGAVFSTHGLPLTFLVVLPVVAAGGLLGTPGAAASGAAVALVALPATVAGSGPFAGADQSLVLAQICAIAALLTGLLVAVIASGRARSADELSRSLAALAEREAHYRAVVDNLAEGLVVHDRDGAVVHANGAALEILGVTLADFLGMSPADPRWLALDADEAPLTPGEHPVVEALELGHPVRGRVIGVPLASGTAWLSVSAQPLPPERGGGVVSLFVDVSPQRHTMAALRDAHEALSHRATHDALTGLADRSVVREHLDAALRGPDPSAVGVLFVDLDDFKDVNDGFGHEAGDEVLVTVARRLEAAVRDHDLVGRVGGDEFVVVCDEIDEPALAALAERIARSVAGPIHTVAGDLVVTASVGHALAEPDVAPEAVIGAADRRMYSEKRRRGADAATR